MPLKPSRSGSADPAERLPRRRGDLALRENHMNAALEVPIWLLQKAPLRWRRFAGEVPGLRTFANKLYPQGPELFALANPLEGHHMHLHWGSRKGFVFGTWEPHVVEAIQHKVRPGQVVVDVGAHFGYFTLLLAKRVGPSGTVVAFEPNRNIFEILKENVALNGYGNVTLENKAVADRSGQVELRLSSRLPLEGIDSILSDPDPGSSPRIKVLAVRLDDYFSSGNDSRVRFVKIDIEGAEAVALAGMSRILHEDRPVLVIELHGADGCPGEHPAFSKLKESGYEVSVLNVADSRAHILAEPMHTRG